MSVNLYEGQIKQFESALQRHRKKLAEAAKKVAGLEKEIAGLMKQARSATSDTSQRGYLSRAESKQRELDRVRDDSAKATQEIASNADRLATAQRSLANARTAETRRQAERNKREEQERERKAKAERQRRERDELRTEREHDRREAERDRALEILHHRTTELEQQLAEAERRAAPEEITVLFLASSPEDQQPLRLDKETREIQKQLRATEFRDSIWFEWRLARQLTDLIQDLNEVKPHILHFSGHGSRAELAFEDAEGRTTLLDNDQLERLLDVGGARIRLVVFNSCDSSKQAELACSHVDVAIGMDSSIGDEAAKTFAAQFYNSLGFGRSIGEAFRQATLQVELAHGKDADVPKLFTAPGVDAEIVVLVDPDKQS
jgi:hypothetical protein